MIAALKSLWSSFSYFLAATAVALAVYFFSSGRPAAVPGIAERLAPRDLAQGSHAARSGLMAAAANLAAYKNRIEKKLESGVLGASFTARDADAVGKLCGDLEPFLLKMRRNVSAADYASQIEAAEAERRALVLENAKLKSVLKAAGPSSGRALRQMAVVEEIVYKLQLHLEGLAANAAK